jgi:hypothetical protein
VTAGVSRSQAARRAGVTAQMHYGFTLLFVAGGVDDDG